MVNKYNFVACENKKTAWGLMEKGQTDTASFPDDDSAITMLLVNKQRVGMVDHYWRYKLRWVRSVDGLFNDPFL